MKHAGKDDPFMRLLYEHRDKLTRQQFTTLRGMIATGNEDAAMKGLSTIIRRAAT